MAILRYPLGGDVSGAIRAIAAGGVSVLEVTVDTPGAWQAIEEAAGRDGLVIGGGTVTEVSQVQRLASLGARFIVSPGFDADVVKAALSLGLDTLPGVATATEILAARRAGSGLFKLFPAGSLGSRYLAELRGPFAKECFVPTGGISIDGMAEWLYAGAIAVALGSDLAGREAPRTSADAAQLTARARLAIAAASSVLENRVGTA
ncbi:MAG: 2-dehydro-3-deoxyphosphogluconate aldolase / (4S)-4-hydroxy-2-oxoglutarate aldolase [Pseudonocardiales bacterium]|nr:2-dehydro-3-deoxyphosphogluconate aldolase / (4S)-4-hydroxy-2-oxoglutarate aldolase [Pseudonocardiales bacterium]